LTARADKDGVGKLVPDRHARFQRKGKGKKEKLRAS